jgi:general stress protein YciG
VDNRKTEVQIMNEEKKSRRGFAAMDPDKVREIAHKGGKAAHAAGTAHKFTSDEARAAGRIGGRAPHRVRGRSTPPPSSPHTASVLERADAEPSPETRPGGAS